MELRPITKDHLDLWRKKYRKKLGIQVIPDLHEALCRMGRPFLIEDAGQACGYVIYAAESLLPEHSPLVPEFYLEVEGVKYARQILGAVWEKLKPNTIISRTDDLQGFPLLMDMRMRNAVAAALYLLEKPTRWAKEEGLRIVESSMEDAQHLLPIYATVSIEDGGIPDEMSLTKSLALWRHYQLVVDGGVAAVGYVVPQTEAYFTISPIVLSAYRGRGWGRYLSAYIINRELEANKIFIAAANPDNEPARGLWESLNARIAAHFLYFKPGD